MSDKTVRKFDEFPPGTTVYTWGYEHPKYGPCGGDSDEEEWSTDRSIMERRASLCEYPTFIIERVT